MIIKRDEYGRFVKGQPSPRKGICPKLLTRKCKNCSKKFDTRRKTTFYCSRKCYYSHIGAEMARRNLEIARQRRKELTSYKYKNRAGYVYIYSPYHPRVISHNKKYVFEHILVMEKKLGRFLRPNEVIHHIDGNVSNNSINNLKLFCNHSEHLKYHWHN